MAAKAFEEMDCFPGSCNEKTRLIPPQQHRRTDLSPPVIPSSASPNLPTTPTRSKQKKKKEVELPSKDYDSLDYDTCYNIPFKERLRNFTKRTYYHITPMRWILMAVIGFLTGIVAFLIDISVKYLFQLKYGLLQQVFRWATVPYPGNGQVVLGFLVLLGFNVLFAIFASSLIALEPVAAGSGIPEIKCYLNGIKVPHVTRLTTLIAKAVGVLFSVAGGFFVGKEGPMIHSGAIIGAGIPQFRSLVCKWLKLPYPYFRSDRDKRDFVSSGAAAGVAAAFGAPIGGVLFSLEEGSSFWNQSLTWRTLFCSFCSTFALNLFLSAVSGLPFAELGAPGLVDFGVFTKSEARLWSAYHLIIFIAMGAVGGLMGALFNSLNTRITIYRMVYLLRRRRIWRILEAVLIIMVTTSAVFLAAMFLGTCVTNPNTPTADSCEGDNSFINETHRYYCPRYGTYYNDMATLMFNSQETAIKQLFHGKGAFTLPTLGIMFIIYFFMACWTYGAGIPSGLFIPCLLIGAIFGRFVATVFGYMSIWNSYYFGFLSNLYPGTYALIGAAAFLGGVVRMTISLTVILIESTNEIDYGLPIMLTLLVAKWVGDLFNEGLYDIHIEVKQVPLLGWESPDHMDRLTAEDVMNSDLHYMFPITRVRSVEQLLRTTAHSAFLIVTPVDTEAVPERPQNVSKMHTPQLYRKQSSLGVETTDMDSDTDLATPFSVNQKPRSRATSSASGIYPTFLPDSSITVSITLPSHSQGVAIQSPSAYSDEEEKPKKLLIFHGIILRSQLVMLMKNRIYFHEDSGPESQPRISHLDLTADYPRYPSVFDVNISESDRDMLMDLSLYMNPSPYTISHQAPLPQVFNLFRTMGLRHLPVMRDSGIVVGIITRHDLTHMRLHEIRHHKKREQRKRKRSPAEAASITSPLDDVFTATNDA